MGSYNLKLARDYEYIYHLAAVIGVRNVLQNPDKVLYVNAISTLNIFEYKPSLKIALCSNIWSRQSYLSDWIEPSRTAFKY